jgi:Fe-S oxidoreductase
MRALPLLEPRRASLEKCVFCPKLCRTACPVSNAEPRETITPWGKMSLAWMSAHGDVPVDRSHAAPAWACTGCFGCRELCDHRNPVADVLLDTRAALVSGGAEGVAPEGARRVLAGFAKHADRTRALTRLLVAQAMGSRDVAATTALLIGCGYVRGAPEQARDAVAAAASIAGGPVAVVEGCCGLPLRLAGDADAFRVHARAFARSLEQTRTERLLVADAGCALALRRRYPDAGASLPQSVRVDVLVEAAAQWLGSTGTRSGFARDAFGDAVVLWHDPCQLGRGLGLYEAPRAVLAHVLGRAPGEFPSSREQAGCAGAGGLLPSTMPEVARLIASARLNEARQATVDGRRVVVVTGCASSLIALRKAAITARDLPHVPNVEIEDVVSFVARASARAPTR